MVQTTKSYLVAIKQLLVPMPLLYLMVFAFVIGTSILLGKAERFSSVSYSGARDFAPWYIWGIALLAYGVALLAFSHTRISWLIVLSGGTVWLFYAIGFAHAAASAPTVGYSGTALFATFWLIHVYRAMWEFTSQYRSKIEKKATNDTGLLDRSIQGDSTRT